MWSPKPDCFCHKRASVLYRNPPGYGKLRVMFNCRCLLCKGTSFRLGMQGANKWRYRTCGHCFIASSVFCFVFQIRLREIKKRKKDKEKEQQDKEREAERSLMTLSLVPVPAIIQSTTGLKYRSNINTSIHHFVLSMDSNNIFQHVLKHTERKRL